MWTFDPPGSPCLGLPPPAMQLILKEYSHALSWMYICGYFAISNGLKGSHLENTNIWGHFFCQNVGIWPTRVSMYKVNPNCYAINFEGIPSYFVQNAYLWLLSNSPNREVLWITPILWVIVVQNMAIGPPGAPIYRVTPYCFAINFEEIVSCFVLDMNFMIFFERSEFSKIGQ